MISMAVIHFKQKWYFFSISFSLCVHAHTKTCMCVYVYMCAYNMQISVDWCLFTIGHKSIFFFFAYYRIVCQCLILCCCCLGRGFPRQLTPIFYPWSSCLSTLWAAVSGACHYAWALSLTFSACMRTDRDDAHLPVCLSHFDGNFHWH